MIKKEEAKVATTRTFKELMTIDSMIASLYREDKELEKTKFGYAYKRFADKNLKLVFKEYQDELGIIRIDNALEDEKTKEVLIDDRPHGRGFKYSKEGLKNLIKEEYSLLETYEEKIIEVQPYVSTYEPKNLPEDISIAFKGLLIK